MCSSDLLASHPAFGASLDTLRSMGVRVLFDPAAPYESRLPSWAEVAAALPAAATQGDDAVSGEWTATPEGSSTTCVRSPGLSEPP